MNDGPEWREIRGWFVRSLRSIGFARREMSEFLHDELASVLQNIGSGGVRQMKPIIFPVIMNIMWTFTTTKKFDEHRFSLFYRIHGYYPSIRKCNDFLACFWTI